MNFILNIFILLFALFIYEKKNYAMTDYQIKEICKKKKRKSFCMRYMKDKRSNLLEGKRIEIPVIPFRK